MLSDDDSMMLSASITVETGAATGAITGTVTRSSDSAPLPDAAVTASTESGQSSAEGAYAISNVAEGPHTVTASRAGFAQSSQTNVSVTAGALTTDIDFSLDAADTTPPTILSLTPPNGSQIYDKRPTISAELSDDSSGIDPASITLKLDSSPVPYVYDSSTGEVRYRPPGLLSLNFHTAYVEVKDMAANGPAYDSSTFDIKADTIPPRPARSHRRLRAR